ncbi:hypothetical protein CR513_15560, partial [Mucuna pruriens]
MLELSTTPQKNAGYVGWPSFKENSPNVRNNPLPEHDSFSVNAVMEEFSYITPIEIILGELIKHKVIQQAKETGKYVLRTNDTYLIKKGKEFKKLLYGLIYFGWVQIYKPRK